MLKNLGKWTSSQYHLPLFPPRSSLFSITFSNFSFNAATGALLPNVNVPIALVVESRQVLKLQCSARRRVRYDDEGEEEEEEVDVYNEEMALLEKYTELKKDEVLLVHACVAEEKVEVLIFKGFSSCLSYKTSSDPSRSVLPRNAIIESIDRIREPYDPTNIHYIDKGLTFESFKNYLQLPYP